MAYPKTVAAAVQDEALIIRLLNNARKAYGMDLGTKNIRAEQDPFQGFEIPPQLEESLKRHRENLENLIRGLRMVGVSEAQIEESVSVVVASYKDELMQAIKALMR